LLESYAYDINGNRVGATVGGMSVSGAYDAQDRLIQYGGAAYIYTANGELMTRTAAGQTSTYRYDALGNLIGVSLQTALASSISWTGETAAWGRSSTEYLCGSPVCRRSASDRRTGRREQRGEPLHLCR